MKRSEQLLEAAHVVRIEHNKDTGELVWEGFTSPIKGLCDGNLPQNYSGLEQHLDTTSQAILRKIVTSECMLESELCFQTSSSWRFFFRRNVKHPSEFYIQCITTETIGEESIKAVRELNARLLIGMSEAHHRVKNTLQNLISYISLTLRREKEVGHDSIDRLIRYIHSLASLHDILLDAVKNHGDGKTVRVNRILQEVLTVNSLNKSVEWGEIPEMLTTPRQAATLSLIVNELLDNARKYGSGLIHFRVLRTSELEGTVEVKNSINLSAPEIDLKRSGGLDVAQLLAKADLHSSIKISFEGPLYCSTVSFPIIPD